MFKRKIEETIIKYLDEENQPILIIDGARQVGKTTTIKQVCEKKFKNFIYINFIEDANSNCYFKNVGSVQQFELALSAYDGANGKLNDDSCICVFIDEIQEYPQFLTLLKFLWLQSKNQNKYKYICSGSLLGVTLKKTISAPAGSIRIKHMYPMDFEEFLWANGINENTIKYAKDCFNKQESLFESINKTFHDLFRKYILIGGLPQAVEAFVSSHNIQRVREVHNHIYEIYCDDAAKYDKKNKLKIKRVYELISSTLENTKKRLVVKNIDENKKACFDNYLDEFDYLISSGIATQIKSISNPNFPLLKSVRKNLVKFYLNDVGLLSNLYFNTSIMPILESTPSVNMGSLYECAVANELKAHGYGLYYFDNKQKGEVDFIIDDFKNLSPLPIEIKSGKNYYVHSALNNLINTKEYQINKGLVFCNIDTVEIKNNLIYLPIYFCMFLDVFNTGDFIIK